MKNTTYLSIIDRVRSGVEGPDKPVCVYIYMDTSAYIHMDIHI
jgi:hypothetical protein